MISKYSRTPDKIIFIAVAVLVLSFNSCKKDPTIPVLSTDSASEITINSATLGGNITSDGGAAVTVRGVCWGTDDNPTAEGDHMEAGAGTGKFSGLVEGLDPNTIYHVRAYARNSVGIAYGNEVVFATAIAAPVITTAQVSAITATTAVSGGVISYNGGAPITESGVCWSTTPQPDLDDSHVLNSTGATSFSSTLTNLSPGTLYYVRAYVKNSEWTIYGAQMTFNTKVADIEGNLYSTVTIGTQVWMAENLKTTKYNDDTPIPNITADEEWIVITSPAYCWFGNNISNKDIYGALYNWYVIGTGKLCPDGWHVPNDEEYKTLEKVLGMSSDQADLWNWRGTDQGSQMKSTSGWTEGGNGTNSSG
ncbi:MAG: fibrobacter succinogenes major paralogous domain-containing protein, partial [Bacteroidales bacterium]|nr:fibrobacter succinogenes major paralogous domain-containing protein [Bacteroidales bacterium]